jgi:hypothetical protein
LQLFEANTAVHAFDTFIANAYLAFDWKCRSAESALFT